MSPATLTALQRTAGNAAVARALEQRLGQREQHTHGAHCGHDRPVQRSAVHEALRSAGRPLDAPVRAEMESRFGTDFSDVRLHTDAVARQSAKEVGALAYTSGSSIVLGEGVTDAHTLAHELTHVVQQRRGPVAGTPTADGLSVSDPADRFEREAEANAHRVMAGPVPTDWSAQRSAEAGGTRPAGGSVGEATVQRLAVVTPQMYLQGLGADAGTVTAQQLRVYVATVLWDDFMQATRMAGDDEAKELKRRMAVMAGFLKATPPDTEGAVREAADLLQVLQTAQRAYGASSPNRTTRYATEPDSAVAYEHTKQGRSADVVWGDDPTMRQLIAEGLGPGVFGDTYPETQPRLQNHSAAGANLALKQLTWPQARNLLPRPLLNLLFDVRFQLEAPAGSGHVVDERDAAERANRTKSPTAPGTLRSWHQDDYGRLPANGFDAAAVPAHGQALHQHYTSNSQSGAGSSVQNQATSPRGYAEYTGTGTNGAHNVKVVLDYIQKRVYLTVTHYQFWALIPDATGGAPYTFWESGSQKLEDAQGGLQQRERGDQGIMMSPWLEILLP
ncbi:DUF4157 domain-containing protein [Streptomyces sp. NPDC088157]